MRILKLLFCLSFFSITFISCDKNSNKNLSYEEFTNKIEDFKVFDILENSKFTSEEIYEKGLEFLADYLNWINTTTYDPSNEKDMNHSKVNELRFSAYSCFKKCLEKDPNNAKYQQAILEFTEFYLRDIKEISKSKEIQKLSQNYFIKYPDNLMAGWLYYSQNNKLSDTLSDSYCSTVNKYRPTNLKIYPPILYRCPIAASSKTDISGYSEAISRSSSQIVNSMSNTAMKYAVYYGVLPIVYSRVFDFTGKRFPLTEALYYARLELNSKNIKKIPFERTQLIWLNSFGSHFQEQSDKDSFYPAEQSHYNLLSASYYYGNDYLMPITTLPREPKDSSYIYNLSIHNFNEAICKDFEINKDGQIEFKKDNFKIFISACLGINPNLSKFLDEFENINSSSLSVFLTKDSAYKPIYLLRGIQKQKNKDYLGSIKDFNLAMPSNYLQKVTKELKVKNPLRYEGLLNYLIGFSYEKDNQKELAIKYYSSAGEKGIDYAYERMEKLTSWWSFLN